MKKTIRILFGVFLLIGVSANSIAQNGTVSAGGLAAGSGGTASYTVGEAAYTTISGTGGVVIEGLQQTYSASDLPVSLLQFGAVVTNNKEVAINWETVSEFNNQYFTVERSKDGESFEDIAKVEGSGSSISKHSYHTIDSVPLNGVSYYRLKQTDVNGKSTYSSIVSVTVSITEMGMTVFPNPTVSYLNLQVTDASSKKLNYAIYSLEGRLVSQQRIFDNSTTISTSRLSAGTYILKITNNNTLIKSFKIIKN